MSLQRPLVSHLEFHLYDRPVHPELFQTLAYHQIDRDKQRIRLRITPNGHVLEYYSRRFSLVELVTAAEDERPKPSQITLPFEGERNGRFSRTNLEYYVSVQSEVLSPEIFAHFQQELMLESNKNRLFYRFPSGQKHGFHPIGLIKLDFLPSGIAISTFHTYPSEYSVIKTQSLIEPQ